MDLAALRERAVGLVERIPILGRLVREFVRVEFIDRCLLIAAQGLLALIPMLVVLSAFFPHVTADAVQAFSHAAGVGHDGTQLIEGEVDTDQVRTQTGLVGLAITVFSATSFARAIQRMYERIWERRHVGGVSGGRRCLLWPLGWLMTLQLAGGLRRPFDGVRGIVGDGLGLVLQGLAPSVICGRPAGCCSSAGCRGAAWRWAPCSPATSGSSTTGARRW